MKGGSSRVPNSAIVLTSEAHDYAPFGMTSGLKGYANLDAFIMAYNPWGYWKLDEASGAPQDSSGNSRHGSVGVAGNTQYRQAAITPRSNYSVRLDTGQFQFPLVQGGFATLSGTWTFMFLAYFEASLGTGSPAMDPWGSHFFGQSNASIAQASIYLGLSDSYTVSPTEHIVARGYNSICLGGSPYGPILNKPAVVTMMGSSVQGVSYDFQIYWNGQKIGQTTRP
jgi:hypothetical protein